MKHRRSRFLPAFLASLVLAGPAAGKVTRVPLQTPVPALSPRFDGVSRLFVAGTEPVKVVVKDERPEGQMLGVRRGKGGDLDFFAAEGPDGVAKLVEKSANEALALLGRPAGEGGVRLEIGITAFWIESYEFGGSFAAANFLAWGRVRATVTAADGRELAARSDPIAMWYLLFPGGAAKTIGLAASVLYERLAWEVTAGTLVSTLALEPDREQVRRLFGFPVRASPIGKAQVPFWLGFAGKGNTEVIDWMFRTFRTAEAQKVYQEAAIALARLNAPGAADELEAVLTGKTKLEEWEPDDVEQAFYLLRALEMLGVRDLSPKVPATKNLRPKLLDLVRLYETGELPAMSPGEKIAYDAARTQLK